MTGRDEAHTSRPYRTGVGAVLFNGAGQVFVARRIDTPGDAWQLPQGGIDEGETPEQAVLRELTEEVGTDKVEIIAESRDWLSYDLPPELADSAWGGRFRGQRQKWFALRFTGRDDDIDLKACDHPEFSDWMWADVDDLTHLIVPFKRSLYAQIVAEFRHLSGAQGSTRGTPSGNDAS